MSPAEIPSPTVGVLHLGPLPIRGYALCILAGILFATWLTDKRLSARTGRRGQALDIAAYGIVFGIIGARLYHVITTPDPYWGENGRPLDALKVWEGGLGIWGAISVGALGCWIGCRRAGVNFLDLADAAVPGVAIAQGIGRWGNWFNNELYGSPTDLPWGVVIHEWDAGAGRALLDGSGQAVVKGVYHPIFLYECLYVFALGVALLYVDRHFRLAKGQLMSLYIAGYPLGRIVLERMRTDDAEVIFGQRLNVWTSIAVFALGVGLYFYTGHKAKRGSPQMSTM